MEVIGGTRTWSRLFSATLKTKPSIPPSSRLSLLATRKLSSPPSPFALPTAAPTIPRPLGLSAPLQKSPTSLPSILSFLPTLKAAFNRSPLVRGPRPYYGGGYGGGERGGGSSSFRQRIDSLPPNVIIFTIIGINLVVLLSWNYAQQLWLEFRDPTWLRFLNDNFLCSMRNWKEGRLWTLFTSAFSHEGSAHFFMNMLSLYFMGPAVISILGNVGFLTLYAFGSVAATCTSLIFHQVFSPRQPYASHGASGAVYSCITFFAACYPRTTFLLFFVVPVPAWLCVSGIFAWDLYNSLRTQRGKTDSAGHVGGVAAGIFWFLRKMGRF